MKKALIAVHSPKASKELSKLFKELVYVPESIVLLHVEQLEGNSMMTAMLSDSEISTLRESLAGTDYKDKMDRQAEKLLKFFKNKLEHCGLTNIKTVIKEGHPSDEILKLAEDEEVDLIIVGCSGKSRIEKLATGCASNEVEKKAKMPVLIMKGSGCGKHAYMWSGKEAYAIR
jgi:nucleotide-binding universal stress UspA family protein